MHKRLEAHEEKLREEMTHRIQALEWADETIQDLGLAPILDNAVHVEARPYYSDAGRYILCVYFPDEQKANVMPLLTASEVDEWKRSQCLAHDEAVGRWGQRLYTDFDHYINGHRITIRFVSPVEEGDAVGDCTVKRIEQTSSRLAIACEAKS